ncbi:hypothetical protein DRN46_04780 [Thermococci archaeon]|nr:MAG: hypothetical protein DRN46_04780 [Thermococci archaeon]RLF93091.1 MAG: hypothetical protein DRN52_06975 [Thermococci archaeon]
MFSIEMGFVVLEGVYPPAEDSILLAENQGVKPGEVVLDVGAGCGIQSVTAARKAEEVVALDPNPLAIANTWLNSVAYGVEEKVKTFLGTLNSIKKEEEERIFDLALMNPPYLPKEDWEPEEEFMWSTENPLGLYQSLSEMMAMGMIERSRFIVSSLTPVEKALELFREVGEVKILKEESYFFERIFLVEVK